MNGEEVDKSELIASELARANVALLRDELGTAETITLDVLKQAPENGPGLVLMGDICSAKGDYDTALNWYDMALGLEDAPADLNDKYTKAHKLAERDRMTTTVEVVGIPDLGPGSGKTIGFVVAGLLVVVLIGAAFIGSRRGSSASVKEPPVVAPSQGTTSSSLVGSGPPPTNSTPSQPTPSAAFDQSLQALSSLSLTEGDVVTGAVIDPRSASALISVTVAKRQANQLSAIAAAIGAFKIDSSLTFVTVREVYGGEVLFIGDVEKQKLPADALTMADPTQLQTEGLLEHVWPANEVPPTVQTDPQKGDQSAPSGSETSGQSTSADAATAGQISPGSNP